MQTRQTRGTQLEPLTRTLRITILAGGPSDEREISLQSGGAIAEALRARGHTVTVADIRKDELSALDAPADVIFPALHGAFGEDGTLQRVLEQRGMCFVASGSSASAMAMDKVATKQLAARAGIPTPPYLVTAELDVTRLQRQLRDAGLHPPVVVKPVDSGSSVGTTIARELGPAVAAMQDAVRRFGRVLVERFIAGDELTVGLLDGQALPPIVIRPRSEFYDYKAKYLADDTEYLFDAGYPPEVLEQARRLSEAMFDRLDCRHLSRMDWMVDRDERLWFLECNTLPGFTSHSLLPKAAARAGIDFEELCERLVRMALRDRG